METKPFYYPEEETPQKKTCRNCDREHYGEQEYCSTQCEREFSRYLKGGEQLTYAEEA